MSADASKLRTLKVNTDSDIELLVALASMFYLFRDLRKALSILAVAEHIDPKNRSVLELQVVLFSEFDQHQQALDTIKALDRLSSTRSQEIEAIKIRAERVLKRA